MVAERSYATLSALPSLRHLEPREILALHAAVRVRDVETGEALFLNVRSKCLVRKGGMVLVEGAARRHRGSR